MPNSSPVEDNNNRQVATCTITNNIQDDSYSSNLETSSLLYGGA